MMPRRPRLELTNDTKTKLTELLLASPDRAERALREVEELRHIFVSISQQHLVRFQRGAPANTELMEVVRLLRLVFRRHYRGPIIGRQSRGATQVLGPQEQRELQFVQTAFQSIDKSLSRGLQQLCDKQRLRRVFLDPRCMLTPLGPKDRTAAIQRIAKNVRQARNLQQPACVLAEKIKQGKLANSFTARDIRRKDWRHLRTNAQVQSALDCLVREGWVHAVSRRAGSRGGRPTIEYSFTDQIPTKPPADA